MLQKIGRKPFGGQKNDDCTFCTYVVAWQAYCVLKLC